MTDQLIQQALLQVLQPILDPTFSEHSCGFRPGRHAQDAVLAAQEHVQFGLKIVVDVDLENFFDRVNDDILIDRLSRRIDDAGVIRLARACLNSGIIAAGEVQERSQGMPLKAARCRRSGPTYSGTRWIKNWRAEVTASFAVPKLRTSAAAWRASR